ncbi:MAG: UDP-N-acetylglucosamine pyrophosphorylase [Deltaproteobacteria bacterium]|nr:UDP-N-acetylglucosamine pyrophosphorylase [Deltaproteobacteria bacterium]
MELKPRGYEKIIRLIHKGVDIPNPLTLDIGEEVDIHRISGRGVKIYPGCRIYGDKTVLCEGSQIGYEAPVTIENCQLGPNVKLKGGFFRESAFLDKAGMGLGAQVREGCLLEEESSGAHCVGLKQTILFPFVTLGSLINFCDCLMAGGTSRKDHSEVGSSYIHFNFTPDGDKTTPSLIGDVPRGVMLKERPIFLGGQGGMVGPLRVGYGNVIAAGAILRSDVTEENKLVVGKSYTGSVTNFTPNQYSGLSRLVSSNVLYLANLLALEEWYTQVRRDFFHKQEFGEWIYQGAIEKLAMAKEERLSRLKLMAAKMSESVRRDKPDSASAARKKEFHEKIAPLCELFMEKPASPETNGKKEAFLRAFQAIGRSEGIGYIETIKSLPDQTAGKGTDWLQQIVADTCERAATLLPSLKLFRK